MPVIAIPAIVIVFAAIVGALIIFGATAFKALFQNTVGRLPLVGGSIAGVLSATFDAVTSGLMSWANATVGAAASFVFGIVSAIWSIPAAATDALGSVLGAVQRLRSDATSWYVQGFAFTTHVFDQLESQIQADAWSALVFTTQVFDQLEGGLQREAVAAQAFTQQVFDQLAQAIQSDAAVAQAFTQHVFDQLAQAIQSEAATAQAFTTQVFDQTIGQLQQYEAQAAADLRNAVAGVEAFTVTQVAGAVGTAERALDQAAHDVVVGPWSALLPQVETIVGSLPAAVIQSIPGLEGLTGSVPVSLPGVLGLLAPAIAAVAAETATCTVPMCRNLGGLSNLLQTLAQDSLWALLVALLAVAVADPAQAAADAQDAFQGPLEAVLGGLRDLVGV